MPIKKRHSTLQSRVMDALGAVGEQTWTIPDLAQYDFLMFAKAGGGNLSLRAAPSLQASQNSFANEDGVQILQTTSQEWLLVPGPLPDTADLFLGANNTTVYLYLSREIG